MTARIPLVINSGAIQELQSGDTFNLGTGASLTSPTIATSMTLSYGTANQVQYLNGSKQLVGDADLTFDGTTLSVAAINVTTVDLTNLEVTNIKAKDGTAAITLADSTGVATLSANPILNAGTANGVAYLNGSKVLTTGSALTFDGTTLTGTQSTASQISLNNVSGNYLFFTAAGGAAYIDNRIPSDLNFRGGGNFVWSVYGGSEQMRLTSTGLGIGTSSPVAKLQSTGGVLVSGALAGLTANAGALDFSGGNTRLIATGSNSSTLGSFVFLAATSDGSGAANQMYLNTSGNLGLGVTPSAWYSASKAVQLAAGSLHSYSTNAIYLNYNSYNNASDSWTYKNNGYASVYAQSAGTHTWYTAPSGTADTAITFTQAMTLDASGNLGIGTTSPSRPIDVVAYADSVAQIIRGRASDNLSAITWNSNNNATSYAYAQGGPTYLAFGTANTERMRIDSSGNVGIGTSSPSQRLTVSGSIKAAQSITIGNGIGGNYEAGSIYADTNWGMLIRSATNSPATGAAFVFAQYNGTESMRIDTSGNLGLGVTPSAWSGTVHGLQLNGTGSAISFSLYSPGTTNGGGLASNAYYNAGWKYIYSGSLSAGRYEIEGTQHSWYTAPSGTAGNAITFTQAMTLDASGNLGIGTTSPKSKLDILIGNVTGAGQFASSALNIYNPTNVGAYSQITFGYTSGTTNAAAYMGYVSTNQGANGYGDIVFGTRAVNTDTQPSERMRIDSSGNVGIGTSSPTNAKLQVNGAIRGTRQWDSSTYYNNTFYTYDSTYGGFAFGTGTALTSLFSINSAGTVYDYIDMYSDGSTLVFKTANAERMRIDSSGNLLMGTTSYYNTSRATFKGTTSNNYVGTFWNPTTGQSTYYLVDFVANGSTEVGGITSNGTGTTYGTASDYRLKENIQPMQNALDVVAQLNPVTYTWKADGSDGQGFIAHELQAVVPDCVTGEKDAVDEDGKPIYQGIDTSFLVATLTKAIQELKAELDATKAEVAALKAN